MFPEHDPYCDRTHTMRQRCNDHLRATPEETLELARLVVEPPIPATNGHTYVAPAAPSASLADAAPPAVVTDAAPPSDAGDVFEPEPELATPAPEQRDAAAAGAQPVVTPYVTREWARTADAVDAPGGEALRDPGAAGAAHTVTPQGVALIAAAALAIAWLLRRGR